MSVIYHTCHTQAGSGAADIVPIFVIIVELRMLQQAYLRI